MRKEGIKMPAEEVFRLAKPKKKGLLPLLFSRFLLIFLLLLLQVGFYSALCGILGTVYHRNGLLSV